MIGKTSRRKLYVELIWRKMCSLGKLHPLLGLRLAIPHIFRYHGQRQKAITLKESKEQSKTKNKRNQIRKKHNKINISNKASKANKASKPSKTK